MPETGTSTSLAAENLPPPIASKDAAWIRVITSYSIHYTKLYESLALELAPRRIRVNCIAPDMIPTPGDAALGESYNFV